jgi:hypothetical protein
MLWGADGKLWFIDHTRAFARVKDLPDPDIVEGCSRRLWEALRGLDEVAVRERLDPFLGTHELNMLLRRHATLVELLEERIGRQGEASVLFDGYKVGGS